ncbi:MAG: aspartate carbamoyltransferase regulatory subunit [Candidatus Altiarchaeum hamiconexum]|uniref:Aspartate carbamoyltransferase regulatory chain n=1 Tax=Candidatus Altarchaeum hamiconexum TaxID=1803513 RepID=A0A8J7YWF0_9ARCH|nr:aspartate carbamoyltransferase regulatory subunit [Candidatus Altarchaeum hamiconexum]PIN66997.1 MAG: aspartate carbamoyltransferase regulatory subunit [Candidatus Altarchaeum sp. CG12_big_fil_rev_8_21_14_0_65_33_22]PIV27185.1 MAG: aspartate carbamoyltransferase regulatory subunit [Candidatus Altarchaeum sp. CG03_land_8_20_14_0_80_32_618]PIX49416.1 MAG: aspartate carbamoyltransferase regulatory subunit [Candidatus Altarchaeum sp. CG_4_8_14_3_um_filter_33_2054]PIZ33222.1 MAG: aspartate carbam
MNATINRNEINRNEINIDEIDKEDKIRRIKNGTVIDHIEGGKAFSVLKILNIGENYDGIVSVVINAESEKHGRKDIIKVEGRTLTRNETNKISLLTPIATVNVIADSNVVEKFGVEVPGVIINLLKCPNPECITNSEIQSDSENTDISKNLRSENIETKIYTISKKPLKFRCHYCERVFSELEFK